MDNLDQHLDSLSGELVELARRDELIGGVKARLRSRTAPDCSLVADIKRRVLRGDWALCPWLECLYRNGLGVQCDPFVADLLRQIAVANHVETQDEVREFLDELRKETAPQEACGNEYENFTVIDIETTGLCPTRDEITELAAVRVRDNVIVDRFQELVSIRGHIPDIVVQKTHITPEMLADARPIDQVLPDFLDFLGDDLLLGYNHERFDIPFILAQADRIGIHFERETLDVLSLVKEMMPGLPRYSLDYLRQCFGICNEGSHRALKDCEDTAQVFQMILSGRKIETTADEDEESFVPRCQCVDPVEIDIPRGYRPKFRFCIPENYKEHWAYVRENPFSTLASANVVITGSSAELPREYAECLVTALGANLKNTVTKLCDFCVILGDGDPNIGYVSGKVEKARAWREKGSPVRILTRHEFIDLCRASAADSAE